MGMTPMEISGEKKMDRRMVSELSDLMLMMDNWKRGYRTWCKDGEDNEWVMREFTEEICEMLQPYMMALHVQADLNYTIAGAIVQFGFDKVDELRQEFKQKETYKEWQ
jgi:hypothetical protein